MNTLLSKLALAAAIAVGLGFAAWAPAGAQEKLKFAFVSHGSIQYPYFVKLKKGMEDACGGATPSVSSSKSSTSPTSRSS